MKISIWLVLTFFCDTAFGEFIFGHRLLTVQDWRGDDPRDILTIKETTPEYIIIHHTYLEPGPPHFLANDIQTLHFALGWSDTGNHFTISKYGDIYEGRALSLESVLKGFFVRGAHAPGANGFAYGIENEGDFNFKQPTRIQLETLIDFCVYLCQKLDINPSKIMGHRSFTNTQCPGKNLFALLPEIRSKVALKLDRKIETTFPKLVPFTSGNNVLILNELVKMLGYSGDTSLTGGNSGFDVAGGLASSIIKFKNDNGIGLSIDKQGSNDATVDSPTWTALFEKLDKSKLSEGFVRSLQRAISAMGYDLTNEDGSLGEKTKLAIKDIQAKRAMNKTGSLDLQTFCAILGGATDSEWLLAGQ